MKVSEHLDRAKDYLISYEVIPPPRGKALSHIEIVEQLQPYNPPLLMSRVTLPKPITMNWPMVRCSGAYAENALAQFLAEYSKPIQNRYGGPCAVSRLYQKKDRRRSHRTQLFGYP